MVLTVVVVVVLLWAAPRALRVPLLFVWLMVVVNVAKLRTAFVLLMAKAIAASSTMALVLAKSKIAPRGLSARPIAASLMEAADAAAFLSVQRALLLEATA